MLDLSNLHYDVLARQLGTVYNLYCCQPVM